MEVLKTVLDIDRFQPAFYLYLGWFQDDRDLGVLGWFGPFSSPSEALRAIPDWWQYDGFEKPRVRFKIFEPRDTRSDLLK